MNLKAIRKYYDRYPLWSASLGGLVFAVFLTYAVTFATGDTFGLWKMMGITTPAWNPEAGFADCSKPWNRSSPYCRGEIGNDDPPPAKELPNNDFDRMRQGGKKAMPFTLY